MISKKTAKLIEYLPKPLVNFIAKLVVKIYLNKYAKITLVNKEKLDKLKKPVIFISNHLSNSDGLILNKIFGENIVYFLAGVKLGENEVTKLGLDVVKFIPVNPNSPDRSAIANIVRIIKSGDSVCIFPEGTRSRNRSLLKGKKGIILIAKLTGVPIVPIGITGTEKLLPINDLDMGDEKFNRSEIKVTIGDSFYIPKKEDEENKEKYEERVLEYIMRKIATLLPNEYRGVYGDK